MQEKVPLLRYYIHIYPFKKKVNLLSINIRWAYVHLDSDLIIEKIECKNLM